MRPELEDALYKKYTGFFNEDRLFFECGDGWYNIIDTLSDYICSIIDDEGLDADYATCVQVKEKYGTLRFYMSTETERMTDLIAFAEGLSAVTCEICGSPGRLFTGAWHKVRCDSCLNAAAKE